VDGAASGLNPPPGVRTEDFEAGLDAREACVLGSGASLETRWAPQRCAWRRRRGWPDGARTAWGGARSGWPPSASRSPARP